MPDGGQLGCDVARVGQELCIEIRDSGGGIPSELEGRLFEPYLTTRSSGTGLGLAIVRRVVEDMGGRVELQNVVGTSDSATADAPTVASVPASDAPRPAATVRGAVARIWLPVSDGPVGGSAEPAE